MNALQIVVMGTVAAAYGVRGDVRIRPVSAQPDTLLRHREWWIRPADDTHWRPIAVRAPRLHSGNLVAGLPGVESREAAMAVRGSEIGIPRACLEPLAADEIYVADLPGLEVVSTAGVRLGTVAAVRDFGAHPVLEVATGDGGASELIPWVPAIVREADLAARRIVVDWQAAD